MTLILGRVILSHSVMFSIIMHFSGISSVSSSQPCMKMGAWHLIKPIAAQSYSHMGKCPTSFPHMIKKKKILPCMMIWGTVTKLLFCHYYRLPCRPATSSTSTQVSFCKFSGSLLVSLNLTRRFFFMVAADATSFVDIDILNICRCCFPGWSIL